MNKINILLTILLLLATQSILAQRPQQRLRQRARQGTTQRAITKTDANIVGHVVSNGKHIPFATVAIRGTTIGITTDETGHYQLIHLPIGTHTVVAQSLGYKPQEL